MQLYLPEQVLLCDQWKGSSPAMGSPGKYLHDVLTGLACRNAQPIMGKGESINVPSLFKQTKGRKENDVCHMKRQTGGSSDVAQMVSPDGLPILPLGMSDRAITYYGAATYIGWLHTRRFSIYVENEHFDDAHSIGVYWRFSVSVASAYWENGSVVTKSENCEFYYRAPYGWWSWYLDSISNQSFFQALPESLQRYIDSFESGSLLSMLRADKWFRGMSENVQTYLMKPFLNPEIGLRIWTHCSMGSSHPFWLWQAGKPTLSEMEPVPDNFIFNEYNRFDGTSLLLLGGGISNNEYWRNRLMQHAFLDACDSLPKLNDNTISNVKDLCSFIYSLVVKHQIDIPKGWRSWWLSYRYVYKTTELDIKEACSYVNRHIDDKMWQTGVSSYGVSEETVLGSNVTCRCRIRVRSNDVDRIHQIWKKLVETGLSPDLYVLWDMLPYSFIIDWFIPVGEMAAVADSRYVYVDSGWYSYDSVVYSLEYNREVDGKLYHAYTRWEEGAPPALSGYYWFGGSKTSDKAIIMRIIDAAALFIK